MARDNERDNGGDGAQATGSHESRECMACRGSGRVISNLGGSASEVSCPWCEGSGRRSADVDAQSRWLSEQGTSPEAPESAHEPTA